MYVSSLFVQVFSVLELLFFLQLSGGGSFNDTVSVVTAAGVFVLSDPNPIWTRK